MVVEAYNPSVGKMLGKDKWIKGTCWPTKLAYLSKSQAIERPCRK